MIQLIINQIMFIYRRKNKKIKNIKKKKNKKFKNF